MGAEPADGALRRDFWMVAGVALGVRLLFCWVIFPHLAGQFEAGDGYDEIGLNLAQGRGYVMTGGMATSERLPVLPFFYAVHFFLFGARSWAWQLTQSIIGAFTCALTFALAARLASRRMALCVAAACTVHPTLLLYTARPFTETLYTFLLLALVYDLARPAWSAWSSGMLFGLQLLIKNTAVLSGLAFLPRFPGTARRTLWALVFAGVLTLPWIAWNLWNAGSAHLWSGRSGITLYHGLYMSRHLDWTTPAGDLNVQAELALGRDLAARGVNASASLEQRDHAAQELAAEWIGAHPGEMLRLWRRNLLLTWYLGRTTASLYVYAVLHGALLLMALIGTLRLWRHEREVQLLVASLLLLIGSYTGFHAALQPAVRYVLPVLPLLAVLAAGVEPRGKGNSPQSSRRARRKTLQRSATEGALDV